tara:strand:+ start:34712 stop:35233 length:522 start_codon:yes stop_codon:yes gene_type:complete
MKKTILLVTSLTMMSLSIISCDNNDEPNCPNALTGELSTAESDFAGNWTLKSMVSEDEIDLTDDSVDNPSTDIFEQYTACQQDIIYEFNADRSYAYKQGTIAADCSDKQTLSGTWKLTDDIITFVGGCSIQTADIDINENSTEFSFEGNYNFIDVNSNSVVSKVVLTYEKNPS